MVESSGSLYTSTLTAFVEIEAGQAIGFDETIMVELALSNFAATLEDKTKHNHENAPYLW
jgi:hypothetical protein